MTQINYNKGEAFFSILYFGPAMAGRATTIEALIQLASENLNKETDEFTFQIEEEQTFFGFPMPRRMLESLIKTLVIRVSAIPGAVYYANVKKLALQGTDGIVFVADSQEYRLQENLKELKELEEYLEECEKNIATIPLVFQYTKRELSDALSVEELNRRLNLRNAPFFEANAALGTGIFDPLQALIEIILMPYMEANSSFFKKPSSGDYRAPPLEGK